MPPYRRQESAKKARRDRERERETERDTLLDGASMLKVDPQCLPTARGDRTLNLHSKPKARGLQGTEPTFKPKAQTLSPDACIYLEDHGT